MLLKMTWLKSLALPAPGCHSPRLNQCTAQVWRAGDRMLLSVAFGADLARVPCLQLRSHCGKTGSPDLCTAPVQGVHIALSSFSSLTGFHLKSVNLEAHGPDTGKHHCGRQQ